MKIKSILSISLSASLLCLCAAEATAGSAFGDVGEFVAGGSGSGLVARNLIYFRVSGTPVFAACAGTSATHFAINADEGGDTIVSTLLAAKMAGKKVHVAGKGTCNIVTGMEDVSYVYLD